MDMSHASLPQHRARPGGERLARPTIVTDRPGERNGLTGRGPGAVVADQFPGVPVRIAEAARPRVVVVAPRPGTDPPNSAARADVRATSSRLSTHRQRDDHL